MKNEALLCGRAERACVKVIRNDWLWYASLGSVHKDVLEKSLTRDVRSMATAKKMRFAFASSQLQNRIFMPHF